MNFHRRHRSSVQSIRLFNDNGKLTGHITDGEGFVHNLRDHGIEIKGKKITVAGGGGAATAIQVQCALDGAREISIFNIQRCIFRAHFTDRRKDSESSTGVCGQCI